MDVEDDNSRCLNRQCAKVISQMRKVVIGCISDSSEHLIMLALISVQKKMDTCSTDHPHATLCGRDPPKKSSEKALVMEILKVLILIWRSDMEICCGGWLKLILAIERLCFVAITIIATVTNDEWCSATHHFCHAELLGYRPIMLPCKRRSFTFSGAGAYWIPISLLERCVNVEFKGWSINAGGDGWADCVPVHDKILQHVLLTRNITYSGFRSQGGNEIFFRDLNLE